MQLKSAGRRFLILNDVIMYKTMATLLNLKANIIKLADPGKAKILQRFFKTGEGEYGEGDIFLGIVVPKQRKLVKKYWKGITLADLDRLIKSKIHEERLIALLILVAKFQKADDILKNQIYNFYLSHTKYINNWDLADLTAPNIVGTYLNNKNRSILYELAKSQHLWERRIAMLATFAFLKHGDCIDTLKIAKILMNDKHDLIHKAVGWMLREVGKKCGEKILINFLNQYSRQMPRVMLRYAIEKLPKKQQQYYLHK